MEKITNLIKRLSSLDLIYLWNFTVCMSVLSVHINRSYSLFQDGSFGKCMLWLLAVDITEAPNDGFLQNALNTILGCLVCF